MTPQEMLQIAKEKGIDTSKYEQKAMAMQAAQPQAQAPTGSGTFLGDMLNKIDPRLTNAVFSGLRSAASGKVEGPVPTTKTGTLSPYESERQKQMAKSEFRPSPVAPPAGFVDVGGKLQADPTYIDPVEQSRIDLNKQRMGEGKKLTPARQAIKDKKTEEIFNTFESNRVKRDQINRAEKSLNNVPIGLGGKIKIGLMKNFDADNPILTDWQNIKSVMTDAQLQRVAKTKGAVSDREMELFAVAAANDDLVSIARMKPVLKAMADALDAQETASLNSYRHVYEEDPMQWPEMQEFNVPEFATEAEAEASGVKGRVKIAGRLAEID